MSGYGYHPSKTERDNEYIEAYSRYGTLSEAGQSCGVSSSTIARALERAGIARTGWKKAHERTKKITDKQLLSCTKSMTRQEIADKYGMNVESLARRMRQLNIHAVYAKNPGDFKPYSYDEMRAKITSRTNGRWDFVERVDKRNIKVKCTACGDEIVRTLKTIERCNTPCPKCKELEKDKALVQLEFIFKKCKRCGLEFITLSDTALYCSKKCRQKIKPRTGGYRHRARHYGVYYDPSVTLQKVIKRDHNTCQICGKPCDPTDLSWGTSGPMYPSIDHIVALKNGGAHAWGNVQLAHIICNSYKRDLNCSREA